MGGKYHIVLPKDKIAEFCDDTIYSNCSCSVPACMAIELSEIIGCKVNLRMPEDLSCYFRKEVAALAAAQYVQ